MAEGMTGGAHGGHEAARRRATLIGATAIVLWATLALLTTLTGALPPFETEAVAFAVGGLTGLVWMLARPHPRSIITRAVLVPWRAWALGVGGLFGYHFLFFLALKTAPAAAANLINYLWPLLIVVFAGLLPGERLGRRQIAGALLGLAGTGALVLGRAGGAGAGVGAGVDLAALPGFLAAAGAAVTWAAYSVLSRRLGQVPTDSVAFFCLATAALSLLAHLTCEVPVTPTPTQWLVLAAMGVGPVGAAFFVWDVGVKRGDIHTLGAISYCTPLLSTLLLILAGRASATPTVALACLAIIGGALIASGMPRPRPR